MLAVVAGIAAVAFFGTVRAMEKGSPAVQYPLIIVTDRPTNCLVRVLWPGTNTFSISANGEALVDIPALPRGCSLVCLGVKLQDGSPYNWKVVEVLRGGRVVRRLSLRQIDRLPAD